MCDILCIEVSRCHIPLISSSSSENPRNKRAGGRERGSCRPTPSGSLLIKFKSLPIPAFKSKSVRVASARPSITQHFG